MTAQGLRLWRRLGPSPRGGRRAPPFARNQLAGRAGWHQAGGRRNPITAGAVEQALDLSGNGRHLTAPGAGNRPLERADPFGREIMRLDGPGRIAIAEVRDSLGSGTDITTAVAVAAPDFAIGSRPLDDPPATPLGLAEFGAYDRARSAGRPARQGLRRRPRAWTPKANVEAS